jgi:hypothetical protein
MATSPIYNWPEPDNTDLVKNGALAIRTMGDAIDTTMGTMTPKSTYTAKGSIAAATAASTPANLSVGANNTYLIADSTAATGLAWAAGTYSTFTPGGFSGFTLGNGTASGRFRQFGKTVFMEAIITLGSTSSVTGSIVMQFPVSANTANAGVYFGQAKLQDTGTQEYIGTLLQNGLNFFTIAAIGASGSYASNQVISSTIPFTWGAADSILITGTYEAA